MTKINISEGIANYSQRNNENDPHGTCNVTSMVMGLIYSGYGDLVDKKVQESGKPNTQPEDLLYTFLMNNKEVADFYKSYDSVHYDNWKNPKQGQAVIPPNQMHAVLSYGSNRWLGKKKDEITHFTTNGSIEEMVLNLLKKKPSVVSGVFSGLGHIVCLVGFETSQENILDAKTPNEVDISKIEKFIIDDPYGDYKSGYKITKGNDIEMPALDFINITRTQGKINNKLCHLFF